MSMDEVRRFAQACKDNNALRDEVAAAGVDLEAFLAVAKRHGFDFTAEELGKAILAKKGELTEEELDKVTASGDEPSQNNLYYAAAGAGVSFIM